MALTDMQRFLLDDYKPQQLSTFALTLFQYNFKGTTPPTLVDFWDTAGQERFNSSHPTYYYQAHACLLCFDLTRKITYKNLEQWYAELTQYRPSIPVIIVANKVDLEPKAAKREYGFVAKKDLPIYFVSASDGTNVVHAFEDAINRAIAYKARPKKEDDFLDEVMDLLREVESPRFQGADRKPIGQDESLESVHSGHSNSAFTLGPVSLQRQTDGPGVGVQR
jgi:Rab-like protein 2